MLSRPRDIMNMCDYQRKVIEAYLSGRDVFVSAPTEAFDYMAGRLQCDSSTRRYHYLKRARAILLRFSPPFSFAMAFLDDSKLSLTS